MLFRLGLFVGDQSLATVFFYLETLVRGPWLGSWDKPRAVAGGTLRSDPRLVVGEILNKNRIRQA